MNKIQERDISDRMSKGDRAGNKSGWCGMGHGPKDKSHRITGSWAGGQHGPKKEFLLYVVSSTVCVCLSV